MTNAINGQTMTYACPTCNGPRMKVTGLNAECASCGWTGPTVQAAKAQEERVEQMGAPTPNLADCCGKCKHWHEVTEGPMVSKGKGQCRESPPQLFNVIGPNGIAVWCDYPSPDMYNPKCSRFVLKE